LECEISDGENVLKSVGGEYAPATNECAALLKERYYGDSRGRLSAIEVLYLIERRSFRLLETGKEVSFGALLLREVKKDPRILAKYIVYRDWRDRGIIPFETGREPPGLASTKRKPTTYPTQPVHLPALPTIECYFFRETEMSMITDSKVAEELYYNVWIGQLGKYKQEKAGKNLFLDLIETIYLMKQDSVEIQVIDASNGRKMSWRALLRFARGRHPEIEDLIDVYSDWRRSGYIVKTGFKFGAHFRIYLPGAGTGKDKWVHSKHVLHVFPKSHTMLMSEWGRIIRLSQSVRKTFILGVPAVSDKDYDNQQRGDLLLYHRTKEGIQSPAEDQPSFLCIAIPETRRMSGLELANALREAEQRGLQLLIAVVDRETDINYYVARKILLEGSNNDYYEIYWYRP